METQLFTWDGWDGDHQVMTFYKVELVRDIGQFPKGTKFDSAHVDFEDGYLQFDNAGPEQTNKYGNKFCPSIEVARFSLELNVVPFKGK